MAATEDEGKVTREVIDMQLGKCKHVRLGENITYIGVGVVLRESKGVLELLMVQEAKRRCYGKWYIPSGRIECGETIVEGVRREVLEETGYRCEPEELLCLQVQGSGWYRFAFYCTVVGLLLEYYVHIVFRTPSSGQRKTVADAESLSSNWFPVEEVRAKKIETRGNDFLKIVEDALRYRCWRAEHQQTLSQFLPIALPVPGLFIEFLIMRHANAKTELLVHRSINECEQIINSTNAFPLAEFGFEYFFATVVSRCFQHMLNDGRSVVEIPSSLTRVQCTAVPADGVEHGLRVRVVCMQKWSNTRAEIRDVNRYHWIAVTDEVLHALHLTNDQYRPSFYLL